MTRAAANGARTARRDAAERGAGVTAMAEQLCDVGRGITLCYETFGEAGQPPLLLIMGLGTQMIGWPEEFCEQLAGRGFYVVRFDNRDSGRSTWMPGRPPTARSAGAPADRRRSCTRSSDMADDALGLLRALELEPAHVVGASMGGMIAQTLAAEHPDAVRSLVSIMSNTGNRWSGQPAPWDVPVSAAPGARDRVTATSSTSRRVSRRSARRAPPRRCAACAS